MRPEVLIIGPFPQPVHGFSAMTKALAEKLEQTFNVGRIDLSSDARSSVRRHVAQLLKSIVATGRILTWRPTKSRTVSIGSNGGLGLLYTIMHVTAARLRGHVMTLHHHSYKYIDKRSHLMGTINLIGGRRMTHVFLAASMQNRFEALYVPHREAAVIANAVFVPEALCRQSMSERLTVGLISNLAPQKGLNDFIDTARLVYAARLPVDMILAGPAPDPADQARIAAAEADGILSWTGPLYGAQKEAFFAGIDLFLFPTRYRHEAQPTVIYEAFAAGVPVIAYDRGSIRDQVGDCLQVLPQEADFANEAVQLIRWMLSQGPAGRAEVHMKAQAKHRANVQAGTMTLQALFGKRSS